MKRITIVPILFLSQECLDLSSPFNPPVRYIHVHISKTFEGALIKKSLQNIGFFPTPLYIFVKAKKRILFIIRLVSREITYFWRWNLRLLLSTSKK